MRVLGHSEFVPTHPGPRRFAEEQRRLPNTLYGRTSPGVPLTSEDLAALGISADVAVHYVRAGWLMAARWGRIQSPQRHARIAWATCRSSTGTACPSVKTVRLCQQMERLTFVELVDDNDAAHHTLAGIRSAQGRRTG